MEILSFLKKKKSSSVAKDRLKLVLIHDRTMLSPRVLQALKEELIQVISKYVDIDKDSINIEVCQESKKDREAALIANIPIKMKK